MTNSISEKLDKNDRAVQLFLNGQFKEMRDKMGDSCRIQKIEVACMPMGDSVTNNYNNRPIKLLHQKNIPNKRRLSQIKDQE